MPLISVIIPVYKVEQYLHRCVDSVLAQTFQNFELILVDDGSPDNCGAICDDYAAQDSRIHVIHQKNGGLSAARNAGLDWMFANSDSRWLTFIDSDDWAAQNYLEVLYTAAMKTGAEISMGCFRQTDDRDSESCSCSFANPDIFEISGLEACKYIYKYSRYPVRTKSENYMFVHSCMKLYARKLFDDVRFPVGKIHEDQGTTYKLLYKVRKVALADAEIYNYYVNSNGITHSAFSVRRFDDVDFLEEAASFFSQRGEEEIAELASIRKTRVLFDFTLKARKNGFYHRLDPKYKLGSLLQQARTMERFMGRDEYEYLMVQYYPLLVRTQCYIRRLEQMILLDK